MKHDTLTEEAQEAAALYALSALCQHDSRAFELHLLEGCNVCEAEKRDFDSVVAALGDADAEAPPAYLRDMLTSRIQDETRIRPFRFPGRRDAETAVEAQRGVRWSVALPWAVAASLLIAVVGVYQSSKWGREAAANQMAAALTERDRLKRDMDRQSAETRELASINEVLSSPGAKTIGMSGQSPAPAATGKVYWDVKADRWVVTAQLPPAPSGKVYQLWFVTSSEKISAGLIKLDEKGHGFAVMSIPPNIGKMAAAAITLEPEGGSAQPSMPIYMLGAAG